MNMPTTDTVVDTITEICQSKSTLNTIMLTLSENQRRHTCSNKCDFLVTENANKYANKTVKFFYKFTNIRDSQ